MKELKKINNEVKNVYLSVELFKRTCLKIKKKIIENILFMSYLVLAVNIFALKTCFLKMLVLV